MLVGGRIAWEYTIRLMLCTGVAAVLSEVLPLQRSYWLVLTVGIILKPDFGSVFARAVQRAIGTVVGAVLGAVILVIVPYGPWLLLPFGVLAALLPFARARNFGLVATFLTPLVVLLIDLLDPVGWRLAEARLIDTVLASAVVLLVGYAPWPSAWQVHLPGKFAEAVRAVADYMDEALATGAEHRRPSRRHGRGGRRCPSGRRGCDGTAGRALSNVRLEFQRTLSEPTPVSRRASAWWPAVVGLEEVMDAVTATAVALGRGAQPPSPASVHSCPARCARSRTLSRRKRRSVGRPAAGRPAARAGDGRRPLGGVDADARRRRRGPGRARPTRACLAGRRARPPVDGVADRRQAHVMA